MRSEYCSIECTQSLPHRRYLRDRSEGYEAFINAAKSYVGALTPPEINSLYEKPFDRNPGNPGFFSSLYQVLNILERMNLPSGARILEVGSGPGWLTEMLMGLGFEVDSIEPSDKMIEVAKQRIAACIEHHRIQNPPEVRFHCQSVEECSLPDESVDAILFHESLHHVIDEDRCLAQCYRVLRPGGTLGVSGESAWEPGCLEQEKFWDEEMARFGTLENPYTWDYLRQLFEKHGFQEVTRYNGINGLFPETLDYLTIRDAAQYPIKWYNNVTANKQGQGFSQIDPEGVTCAEIDVRAVHYQPSSRQVSISVRLVNRGETTWPHRGGMSGYITLALVQGPPGGPYVSEGFPRCRLPERLAPGGQILIEAHYQLPKGAKESQWHLDLVCEHMFWLSSRGTTPAEVRLRG